MWIALFPKNKADGICFKNIWPFHKRWFSWTKQASCYWWHLQKKWPVVKSDHWWLSMSWHIQWLAASTDFYLVLGVCHLLFLEEDLLFQTQLQLNHFLEDQSPTGRKAHFQPAALDWPELCWQNPSLKEQLSSFHSSAKIEIWKYEWLIRRRF